MIYDTPKRMDINELEKCPTTRSELFRFYKSKGAETEYFEDVLRYIENGGTAYFSQPFFAFYNQEGILLAGENPDWGD
ncbi:hypothetical protein M5X00_00650 [Paenibacillus alvei]|uniref:Uncharacterized protein n=1 Tax=Paenibacillus alvei TaxID=44250 RepID=A0ABT4H195_PAEAL|nr:MULTISPECIES: hypothetical protein [Paenibacillus]EJW13762.1 hypothetical protein PAV_16p00100 [Paenibacillus alvei DSM 29]MCY9540762.1 hypothetical protein [Paenibacillus alvei]MCY9702620.1 hypothetical protein [Paenibacillus alvei]MCY9732145.1 hypothetical protein [Paenibacillus alvei]MCY9752767.1 hypothetical protein [Paenibacillus alvei]